MLNPYVACTSIEEHKMFPIPKSLRDASPVSGFSTLIETVMAGATTQWLGCRRCNTDRKLQSRLADAKVGIPK